MKRRFRVHDVIVYEKPKHGTHPTPRAHDLRPTPQGESYDYVVDKYWIVVETIGDAAVVARTPGGKLHEIDVADPRVRHLTWFERARLLLSDRGRLRALREPGL